MNGYKQTTERKYKGSLFMEPSYLQAPKAVDWREKGYVTPIKDQVRPQSLLSHDSSTHTAVSLNKVLLPENCLTCLRAVYHDCNLQYTEDKVANCIYIYILLLV